MMYRSLRNDSGASKAQLLEGNSFNTMRFLVVCFLCMVFVAHGLALRSAWNCATPVARALRRLHLAPFAMSADSGASIKERLAADMKEAMKMKEKIKLGAIRSVQVAIKQKEVDDRVEVT
jgi:hypothetical protein